MIEPDDPGLWPPATKQRSPVDALRDEFEMNQRLAEESRVARADLARQMGTRDIVVFWLFVAVACMFVSNWLHTTRARAPVPVEVDAK